MVGVVGADRDLVEVEPGEEAPEPLLVGARRGGEAGAEPGAGAVAPKKARAAPKTKAAPRAKAAAVKTPGKKASRKKA